MNKTLSVLRNHKKLFYALPKLKLLLIAKIIITMSCAILLV
jgi:hypothetical protein